MGCGALTLPVSHQLKRPEIDTLLEDASVNALWDDRSGTSLDGMALEPAVLGGQEGGFGC